MGSIHDGVIPKTTKIVPIACMHGTQYEGLDLGVRSPNFSECGITAAVPPSGQGSNAEDKFNILWNVTIITTIFFNSSN